MASTWSPEDFLEPHGLLRPDMFPKESDLSERISSYIDGGEERASSKSGDELDLAVEYWVYGNMFLLAFVDYNADPAVNQFADQGSETYNQTQIDNWKKLSDEYLAKFNNLIAATADKFGNSSRTQAVANRVVW